jgi:hypothetical protein
LTLRVPHSGHFRNRRVSPDAAVPATISILNPQPPLRRGGGNRADRVRIQAY